MKKIIFLFVFAFPVLLMGQNKIATTEDGKRVLLKADSTWEFIDTVAIKQNSSSSDCNATKDQIKVKTYQEDLRKYVAKDNNCEESEVKFIAIYTGYANSTYTFCVKGKIMRYRKQVGMGIFKED